MILEPMTLAAATLPSFPPFTAQDYRLGAPVIVLTLFSVGILCFDLAVPTRLKQLNALPTLVGLAAAAYYTRQIQRMLPESGEPLRAFFGCLVLDSFAVYFFYLFLVGAALAVLISIRYLEVERENHGEFYALLLFSVIGMMCMAAGYDLVLIFIGLELMAISTYILAGFLRSNQRSNEAGLKYLLLGAFSSAIFAYGLSLFYGVSGSTNLGDIAHALTQRAGAYPKDPIVMLALLIFGLFPLRTLYVPILVFAALLTLTTGNLAAITQTNTKRLLAYSSIAHVGYMLLGLIASDGAANRTGIKGILFYLLAYTFMNMGAFAVLTALRRRKIVGDEIGDISGLFQKAPTEALLMLVFLLSLAGVPPLAGFYGKYFVFLSLIETGHYVLASAAVLYAVIGFYYYLKIANAMFMGEAATEEPVPSTPAMNFALVITATATIVLGLFPNVFIRAVEWSVTSLGPGGIALLK